MTNLVIEKVLYGFMKNTRYILVSGDPQRYYMLSVLVGNSAASSKAAIKRFLARGEFS